MRIKFTETVNSSEEFKEKFCDMIDKLPFNIDDYRLSGINLYFNVSDKNTGCILELAQNGNSINFLSYGSIKQRRKLNIDSKSVKKAKVINFNNKEAKI